MTQTQHTPTPWSVSDDFSDTRITGYRNGKLANIVTGTYDEDNEPTLEEQEANARLIAAAPEMYNTCKRALLDINYLLVEYADTNIEECQIEGVKDTINELKDIIKAIEEEIS